MTRELVVVVQLVGWEENPTLCEDCFVLAQLEGQMTGDSDVLRCKCGALELEITAQSYGDRHAFKGYRCEGCGQMGSLTYDEFTGTTLDRCLR